MKIPVLCPKMSCSNERAWPVVGRFATAAMAKFRHILGHSLLPTRQSGSAGKVASDPSVWTCVL